MFACKKLFKEWNLEYEISSNTQKFFKLRGGASQDFEILRVETSRCLKGGGGETGEQSWAFTVLLYYDITEFRLSDQNPKYCSFDHFTAIPHLFFAVFFKAFQSLPKHFWSPIKHLNLQSILKALQNNKAGLLILQCKINLVASDLGLPLAALLSGLKSGPVFFQVFKNIRSHFKNCHKNSWRAEIILIDIKRALNIIIVIMSLDFYHFSPYTQINSSHNKLITISKSEKN